MREAKIKIGDIEIEGVRLRECLDTLVYLISNEKTNKLIEGEIKKFKVRGYIA